MIIFRSLKSKFAIGISCILILVFLAQAFINIRATEKKLIEGANRESFIFAQLAAKSFVDAYEFYYFSDFQKFREVVEDAKKLTPYISRVRLKGEAGKILFDTQDIEIKEGVGPVSLEQAVRAELSYDYKNKKKGRLSEITYSFFDESGSEQHSLIYSISYQAVERENLSAITRAFFLALLLLNLSIFLISFLTIRITKPLLELEQGTQIIAKGNLEHRLRIKTGDEIGRLAEEFNKMAEKLRVFIRALVESKSTLEKRIKERTRELEEEKNKTLAIVANLPDGVLVFDEKNNLTLMNSKAQEFFNVSLEKVRGKSLFQLSIFPGLKLLVNFFGEEIRKVFREDFVLTEQLAFKITTLPLMREEKGAGNLVILHDVSRERLVERMKTEFVALTAHQLRTPLSAIKWTIRMLLDGDLGRITKNQKEFLEKTYKSNEKMIALINDLLNVTRIEEGRYIYKPILADFLEIVHEVVRSSKGAMQRRGISFKINLPKEKLPEVFVDKEKIKLVIENLLDNAIKYTKPNGKVALSVKNSIKELEFDVQDTGVGIPKDQQERVFTKFFRGANVMRLETEGYGLGLFISKNIIEAHGGKIWFESQEGNGAKFSFVLPINNKNQSKKA
ncbi:MAG: ATP-binding protein [Patescibacteria group bacterium]